MRERAALDRELGRRGLVKGLLVLGELLRHLAVAVVVDDLGAVANEQLGVDQAVNVVPDGLKKDISMRVYSLCQIKTHLEELGLLDPLKEVVAATLLLHNIAGLVGLLLLASSLEV